jgi:hypothetical protein
MKYVLTSLFVLSLGSASGQFMTRAPGIRTISKPPGCSLMVENLWERAPTGTIVLVEKRNVLFCPDATYIAKFYSKNHDTVFNLVVAEEFYNFSEIGTSYEID